MRTLKTLLTTVSIAVLIIAAVAGVHNASNRRAEYLEAEAVYFECIESGLSRAECAAGVGW